MKKKLVSLVLAIAMLCAFLPVLSFGATIVKSGTCGNLKWTLDDNGTLTISGTGEMFYRDFIESSWCDLCSNIKIVVIENGVTSIGEDAFEDCESLTSVKLPYSVTSIGNWAFNGCKNLEIVSIPNSVTSIGNRAFGYCESLESISIPDSVTSIGWSAFSGTAYYNNEANWENEVLYIGNHLIEAKEFVSGDYIIKSGTICIGNRAFGYCESLESISIPDSVTSIGEHAFEGCTSLESVSIGNSVTSIGQYAFGCCESLESVSIPDSVTSIGSYTFEDCESLESVSIGNSVTDIGYGAFYGCTSLTSISIPDSVTSIEDETFYGCSSLTSISIPSSVTSIGDSAFYGCDSLTDVYYDGSNEDWAEISIDSDNSPLTEATIHFSSIIARGKCGTNLKWTMDKNGTLTINGTGDMWNWDFGDTPWHSLCSNIKTVVIENGVTNIGDSAFYGCDSLTSVKLPDSVTSIGNGAFEGTAYYRDKANWENEVLYIGNHLIEAKDSVSGDYIIKSGTISISDYAFRDCDSLTSVKLSDSVTSIGDWAFEDCDSLTSVKLPDSVTDIGYGAFYGCTSLTNIRIPDSVTSIGNYTFEGCYSLTSVKLPDSVTSIGSYAFRYCYSLTSVRIPDSVTSIGESTFFWCSGLTSVTIPSSVTSIGDSAFYSCDSLTDVYYTGSEEDWAKILIDDVFNASLIYATIHYNYTAPTHQITNAEIAVSGDRIDVSIETENIFSGAKLFVIGYGKGGECVRKADITGNSAQLPSDGIEAIKVFCWESLDSMRPLCEAKTVTVQ